MAQILAKDYECLTCHEPIKISKIDNHAPGQKKKWDRYELDGVTPHQCKKKEEDHKTGTALSAVLDNGPQLSELAKQVSELKDTVNILISQIQMLRSEVKSSNSSH